MTEPRRRRRWPKILGGILLVLVVLVAAGLFALDRILLSQARKQAAALSAQLGRPVAIGDVETKLWGGIGARVSEVSVGAGEGEGLPLAELRRAEVDVAVLPALLSMGKNIHVREVVVEGLRVNVVKLADGTTNVERVTERLAKEDPAAKAEEKPAEPASGEPALERLRIDRAAVENARIAFVDRTVAGAKELFVEDLDVEVKDLETGEPLEVVVRAAVLAEKQNLSLRMKAAPLPATLEPTPEELALDVEPIVLDPLAPFLPKDLGFRGGKFQADLDAKLGGAVPGGKGPTIVKGGFRATDLAFAGQEGGKPLDVSLDADLEADANAGDLRIGKLVFTAGPASLVGKGRASGLTSDAPKFEDLEIVARNLDLAALEAHYPPLRKAMNGTVAAGPIGLSVRGSGTAAAQRAEIRVDLTPVRLVVPEGLAKGAGAPMTLLVRADAAQGGGRVGYDATLDLAGADLRPGGTLAKKPGDPLSVKARGSYRATKDTQEIRVDGLDVALLGDRLTGKATATLAGEGKKATTKFEASLSGDRLDLDKLLLEAPKKDAKEEPEPEEPLDPSAFQGLSGTADLRLGLLRMEGQELRNVVARVRVEGDEVRLDEAKLEAFGGSISAAGTHLALARPQAPFEVALDIKNVAGAEFLKLLSERKVLAGTLDAGLKLGGNGWQGKSLLQSVTGGLKGNLRGGSFHGKDLVASIAGPIAAKLPFAAGKVTDGGRTDLGKELPFAFSIADGLAKLDQPLRVETGQGAIELGGGVRLDGTLQMPATFALAPELVARITNGRAKPSAPIPVTFNLSGPAWSPRLEGLALDAAVKAIAGQAAGGAIGRAVGVEGATSVEDAAAKKRAEAEARARQEAEERKKKLEEEAKKRLRGIFGK
jgi:AsmA protein